MFRRGGQIFDCLIVVLRDVLAVEIELAELVFGVVVATLGCNFEVPYGFVDVLVCILGEPDLSRKVGGIRIFLCR